MGEEYHFRSSLNKDYSFWSSILGAPHLWKLLCGPLVSGIVLRVRGLEGFRITLGFGFFKVCRLGFEIRCWCF